MSAPQVKHDFRAASSAAVADQRLQDAVKTVTNLLSANRARAVAEYPGFEALRSWGREKKLEVSADLEHQAKRFSARVEALGGVVHRARNAEDVGRIVEEIARRRGIRRAVKSKSMTAEEVGLNHFLEAVGVEVTETDLGEFIIQLAGEKPSHILAPAIHRSREEISQLFSEQIGAPEGLDAKGLVDHARAFLRQRFLRAEMGITGANFAIAETGTLVLVTNEGNGRMCTSLPPVHVALVGIDKVLPKAADLPGFLTLLTRSASGQAISSYVTMTSGPRRAGDGEGPEELHVILLDNGRSAVAAGPLREMLHCLHCSSCLNHCPVYRSVGGHAWESPYPGPMGSVFSSLVWGQQTYPDLADACTLCGRCAEVCPVKIPLPDFHLCLRRYHPGAGAKNRLFSTVTGSAIAWPTPYRIGMKAARRLLRAKVTVPLAKSFSASARAWMACRELPQPEPGPSFRHWLQTQGNRTRSAAESLPAGVILGPPAVAAAPTATTTAPESLLAQYVARAEAAGTQVRIFPRQDLASNLETLLDIEAVAAAALPAAGWPQGMREEMLSLFARRDCRVVAPLPQAGGGLWDRDALAEVTLGVLYGPAFLADSGSLIVVSGTGMGTLASLLPDISLVITEAANLVESFGTYLEQKSGPWAARTTLVSGPSRTGDIPGSMTIGVHGPRKVMHWIISQ